MCMAESQVSCLLCFWELGCRSAPRGSCTLGTWMRRSIAEDEGKLHPRVWGPPWGGFAGSPGCAGAGFCTGVTGWDWFLQEIPPSRKGKLPSQGLCMSCSCGIMELAWGAPCSSRGSIGTPSTAAELPLLYFFHSPHAVPCVCHLHLGFFVTQKLFKKTQSPAK